jgi:hypothetical protein
MSVEVSQIVVLPLPVCKNPWRTHCWIAFGCGNDFCKQGAKAQQFEGIPRSRLQKSLPHPLLLQANMELALSSMREYHKAASSIIIAP